MKRLITTILFVGFLMMPTDASAAMVQRQKLTGSDPVNSSNFGHSVAIQGDTMVVGSSTDRVGSHFNQGTAYVFIRVDSAWVLQAHLIAADGDAGDNFGSSVAISGDTIVVGAEDDSIAFTGQGSAYIFVRNGTTWSPQERIVAGDAAEADQFGSSVSISGDTVSIGADNDKVGSNTAQGSAYVFVRNGGAWTLQQKVTASDGQEQDIFGISVAISGGTVIIGAPGVLGQTSSHGAAYVFARNGTVWSQQSKLTASDGDFQDAFGGSVDITNTFSGILAVIGARDDDIGGSSNQGSAYVFNRSQTGTWSQTQKLIAPDGNQDALFGSSIAVAPLTGSTIVIGAEQGRNGSNIQSGAGYVFKRVNTEWTLEQKLTASDAAFQDDFGTSVDISGETAIFGADRKNSAHGAAYVFDAGGASPFDFDGDAKTDLGIFRPANGQWWINRSSDGNTFAATFGSGTDRITPGDLTGDGKTDIALFRPSTGQWFVLRSEDSSFYAFPFGTNGDVPAPADYDADGKTDAAVFRPSNSTWFISNSGGGTTIQTFGQAGDVPVAADYDGDAKADIAIYRPSLGQWWIQRSTLGAVAYQFGAPTDKTVAADYTGDGKADVGFWRPSTGEWFILRSEDNSYYSFPFGASSDLPAPGDYDGDGKADAGVFRPSSSTWFINKSGGGTLIQQFGQTADLPLPNAFVR